MTSTYELSISANYVPKWGVNEALRELAQNAEDAEVDNPDNKAEFIYDKEGQMLIIGNSMSELTHNTLLLGETSKGGNTKYIGAHGEGYKLAAVVLLRNGKSVVFHNQTLHETWTPRLKNSKKYESLIPVFDVQKDSFWNRGNKTGLYVSVSPITQKEYTAFRMSNLRLRKDIGETIDIDDSRILLEKRFKGKVYVRGLLVEDCDNLNFGYDFSPSILRLNRDRQSVESFDLLWATSTLWSKVPKKYIPLMHAVLQLPDGAYVGTIISNKTKDIWLEEKAPEQEVATAVYTSFKAEYGENAVPVSSQTQAETLAAGQKPVIVSDSMRATIRSAPCYTEKIGLSVAERLKVFRTRAALYLPADLLQDLDQIIKDM